MNKNIPKLVKKDKRIIFSVSQINKDKFVSESNLRGLSLSDFIRFCILKEISKSKGDFHND